MAQRQIFFTLLFCSLFILSFSCKKEEECEKRDWTGNYVGRDFITKMGSNGSNIVEPSIEAKVEITWNSDPLIGNNILLKVTLLYSNSNPTIITLYGDATCEETFTFRDKGDYRPQLKDSNNNYYTIEYSGSSGSYLNNSKDVQIKITEKKIYDLVAFQSQNYTATHTLKLNRQ